MSGLALQQGKTKGSVLDLCSPQRELLGVINSVTEFHHPLDWRLSLYKNHLRLGNHEPANGFEHWRKLIADNRGKGVAVKLASVTALNSFPQCQSVSNLGPELDAWENLYVESGNGLDNHPNQLYVMLKDKLLMSIVTDLLDHPHIVPHRAGHPRCPWKPNR